MLRKAAFALWCLGLAISSGVARAETFCCNDDSGRQVCSDRLPQICYNRAYKVIGTGGMVIRSEEAPLTPRQRREREEAERKRKEEDRLAKEEQRRNKILAETYSSVQDIDDLRDRTIRDIEKSMSAAREEMALLQKDRQKLAQEAEFYKRRTMPYELASAIRANEADIAAKQSVIDAKKKEIEAVNARFDEDRRRYVEYTRAHPRGVE